MGGTVTMYYNYAEEQLRRIRLQAVDGGLTDAEFRSAVRAHHPVTPEDYEWKRQQEHSQSSLKLVVSSLRGEDGTK
jgi:hypothetical protein